ncbi:hypothetical protein FB567DRAFT_598549 [Paraphoma chrysanthemicola]|uniref:Uncharacterized protein n=1 Tax=Paraphoma chrysanthemicola TaxID=798071 RepID=A0A8K0QTZ9_9PLEO|nr:hypothetical protein FB567DRAFT_598549 [Paraphoma chrysanthemicola]
MAPSSTARPTLAMKNAPSDEESVSLSQHTQLHLELAAWAAMPSPAVTPRPYSLETYGQDGFVSFNWSTGRPTPFASPRAVPTPSNTSSFGRRQGPGLTGFFPFSAQARGPTSCSAYAQSVHTTAGIPPSDDSHPNFSRPDNTAKSLCRTCPQGVVNAFDSDNAFGRCMNCRIQPRLVAGWSMSRARPDCQVHEQLATDASPSGTGLVFSGPPGPPYSRVSSWVDDLVRQPDDSKHAHPNEPTNPSEPPNSSGTAETFEPTALSESAALPTPTNTPKRSHEDIYAYAEYLTRSSDPQSSWASPLAAEEPVLQLEDSQPASPRAPSSPAASLPEAASERADSYHSESEDGQNTSPKAPSSPAASFSDTTSEAVDSYDSESEHGQEAPSRALSSPAASISVASLQSADSHEAESENSQNAPSRASSRFAATLLGAASQIAGSLRSAFERGDESPLRAPSTAEAGYASSTGSSESETFSSSDELSELEKSETAVPYQHAWSQPSQDFFFFYRKMPTELGVSWEDLSNIIEAHLKTSDTMSPEELMEALQAHKARESQRRAQSNVDFLLSDDDASSFATISDESVKTDTSSQYKMDFRVVDDDVDDPIPSPEFEHIPHSPHMDDFHFSPEPTQMPFARLAFASDLTEAEMGTLRTRVVHPDDTDDLDSLPDLIPLSDAMSDTEFDDEDSDVDSLPESDDDSSDLDSLPEFDPLPDAVSDGELVEELSGYDGSIETGGEALESGDEALESSDESLDSGAEDLELYDALRDFAVGYGRVRRRDRLTGRERERLPTMRWVVENSHLLNWGRR